MTNMYVLVEVCIWDLGYYKLESLEARMGFLELCSLCLFDIIVELHATNEKTFSDFPIIKLKRITYVIEAYFIHVCDLYM